MDRWGIGVKVHGDPDSTRAEIAGILACLDEIPHQCHAVKGTDSDNALTIMDRFRGKNSAQLVDGLPYRDLLEPLGCIRRRSAQGARTSFMKVRAHRGLPVNEVADEWAAKGHTSVISLGEDRCLELDHDLPLTKLTAAGRCSDKPAEVSMRWSKALQRRLAADEAWMVVRKFIDKGNRNSQFMLRPGEGRWNRPSRLGRRSIQTLWRLTGCCINGTLRNTLQINV